MSLAIDIQNQDFMNRRRKIIEEKAASIQTHVTEIVQNVHFGNDRKMKTNGKETSVRKPYSFKCSSCNLISQ